MEALEIQDWLARGQELLDRCRSVLAGSPDEGVRALARCLPSQPYDEEQELRVVFAGQYNAGKSTILRVLTGREDILIGSGVTTKSVQELGWNGIKVLDTPGVHTTRYPDHDALTYEAIARADLLVFVVTNELFDSLLGEHFRSLAVDRGKGHEMMLVVNKMQRSATGNTREVQDVITEDLRKVLTPYTPEQMRISFTDAECALETLRENDPERRAELWRDSGFSGFMDQLNEFVRSKDLESRFTTGLYMAEQVLHDAQAKIPPGDTDLDAAIELLTLKRRAFLEARSDINTAVNDKINGTATSIRQEGETLAGLVNKETGPEYFQAAEETAIDHVQELCDDLDVAVQEIIDQHCQELDERFEAIHASRLSVDLRERLEVSVPHGSSDVAGWKATAIASGKLGQFLFGSARGGSSASAGLFSLRAASGSGAHGAVKAVGGFLGYKFVPWQAVKIARGIGAAGKFLSVAGPLLEAALAIKSQIDANREEKELQAARDEIRANFEECAHQSERSFRKGKDDFLKGNFAKLLSDLDYQLTELRSYRDGRVEISADLNNLTTELRTLIGQMHYGGFPAQT